VELAAVVEEFDPGAEKTVDVAFGADTRSKAGALRTKGNKDTSGSSFDSMAAARTDRKNF